MGAIQAWSKAMVSSNHHIPAPNKQLAFATCTNRFKAPRLSIMHSDITKPRSLFGKRGALNIYNDNSKKATAKTESHVRGHNNKLSRNQSGVIIE